MSTLIKQLRFYVMSAMGRTSTRHLLSERLRDYSQDNLNRPTSQSPSSNAQNVGTSTESSSQRKFNPSTDSYSGIHDYE